MQKSFKLACNTPHDIRAKYLLNLLYSIPSLTENRHIWNQREINNADNTLEHTEKVLIAANLFAQNHPEYNYYLLQDKAIIHDYTGNISKLENIFLEQNCMKAILNNLPPSISKYGHKMWLDFKLQKTPEDKILHQLNTIDPAILALDLEQKTPYHNLMLSDIYPQTQKQIEHPILKKIFNYMLKREYEEIGAFAQYIGLLKLDGDIDKFKEYAEYALTTTITQQILFNLKN
jgi:hypothetical protein